MASFRQFRGSAQGCLRVGGAGSCQLGGIELSSGGLGGSELLGGQSLSHMPTSESQMPGGSPSATLSAAASEPPNPLQRNGPGRWRRSGGRGGALVAHGVAPGDVAAVAVIALDPREGQQLQLKLAHVRRRAHPAETEVDGHVAVACQARRPPRRRPPPPRATIQVSKYYPQVGPQLAQPPPSFPKPVDRL